MTDAARRAREDLEELGLIREVHGLIEPTVTKAEGVVELAHRLAHSLRAVKRAVVDLRIVGARAAHHGELRCHAASELDEGEVSRVALHRHVEAWTEPLDQPQLLEQRGEFARRVIPLDAVRLADDARSLLVRSAAEVAEQSGAQPLGLAHERDQPHILNATGSYRLGRGWELGASMRYTPGRSFALARTSVRISASCSSDVRVGRSAAFTFDSRRTGPWIDCQWHGSRSDARHSADTALRRDRTPRANARSRPCRPWRRDSRGTRSLEPRWRR